MTKYISVFFALFIFFKASAQNNIFGVVTDEENNPLIGATVSLPELNKGTTTNQHGRFLLDNLPNEKLKVQFSYMGFITQIHSIDGSLNNDSLVIVLVPAIIASEEVVVTGGYVSSQHENAVKIDVLKQKALAVSGTPNFMETITQVPGVDMIAKGPGVAKPIIRGLSMNNILVLNNGVRIENYQFGEDHPLGINDNDMERVEIIKGPASLLYGSDAIGGVLNFIKEKPAPTGKVLGDYRLQLFSNTLGMNNSIGIKGASKKFFGAVRYGQKTHADYLQGNGEYVPNSRFNETTLNVHAGYTGKIGVFKLYYDLYQQGLGMTVPPAIDLITERGRNANVWYQDLSHQIISSQNKLFLGRYKWDINLAYQNALRKLQTTLDVPFIEMDLGTLTYDTKLHFPSREKSDYSIGIQGMSQKNENLNDRESQFLPNADINNLGVIAMAQYNFIEQLKIQGGLRFDSYHTETYALGEEGSDHYHAPVDKRYFNVNGSLGATYNPDHKLMLRLNLAKAYRVPNISELTSNGAHGNRAEMGNPDLVPQDAYEADVSMHFHETYLSFDLAGFYNHIDNYIYLAPTTDTTHEGISIYEYTQTKSKLYGGEAGIHFHPKTVPWLHLQATYAGVIGKQQNGEFLPFIPAQKLRYELRVEREEIGFLTRPNIILSALSAFSQNKPSDHESVSSGYTLVNLSLNTDIKVANQLFSFTIAVNNIFDVQYYDHLSTLKELNYYNAGRNVSLSLNIPFALN